MKRIFAKVTAGLIPSSTLRKSFRSFILSENKVFFNGMVFDVLPNPFWFYFNTQRWEPETIKFYREHISPTKEVIDIGGWIGPTVLMAYALNAKKIHVVEADPVNYQILKKNCYTNVLQDKVELHNLCISHQNDEIVSFGCSTQNNSSSTKRIGQDGVKVVTTNILDFLKSKDLNSVNIIKIDIEGSEQNIIDGIKYISDYKDISMVLSLHPPFWKDQDKVIKELINVFVNFDIYDENQTAMSLSECESFLNRSKEKFFSIILKTK
jgi:FkbM family methyltransferase